MYSYTAFDFSGAGSIWPPFSQRLWAQYLTDDYLDITGDAWRVTSAADDDADRSTESPDIFFKDGNYYVTATNTCAFCNGTLSLIYRSPSIEGPWKRQLLSPDGCGGQLGSYLPIKSSKGVMTYLGFGDQWCAHR